MASLNNEGPKKWRIQFMDTTGTAKRRQIRFSGHNKKQAETIFHIVERLIEARRMNVSPQPQDQTWLAELPDKFYAKLVRNGLAEERIVEEPDEEEEMSLRAFVGGFIARRKTLKGNPASHETVKKWEGTFDLLLQCFDESRCISEFTLDDARKFRSWMERRKIPKSTRSPTGRMAENSMRQRIANCKTFFSYAVKEEFIEHNPFRNQVSNTQDNDDGKLVISREIVDDVIAAAPNSEWKLLIALWRYAGLRKMEPMGLEWEDVLWNDGKLRVRPSKTRHHRRKRMREVPIRDVEVYLRAVQKEAGTKSGPVISRYAQTMSNFHKPFETIIRRAGYEPWPNLIKNLRLSCENDWLDAREAPDHVIAAWIGHSVEVQKSDYAVVSEGHFGQFNSRPSHVPTKKASIRASDDVRTDENRPEKPQFEPHFSGGKKQASNKKARFVDRAKCSGEDSNLHGLTPTCPSSMRVYQFHHQSGDLFLILPPAEDETPEMSVAFRREAKITAASTFVQAYLGRDSRLLQLRAALPARAS